MIKMTHQEWEAEGLRRFGPSQLQWKFVCPACGHVQAVEDFRPYKHLGATAESASFKCIGRYACLAKRRAFGDDGPGPCDYTSGGLFNISPIMVISEGKEIPCLAFAD
jgi:hypothetical protein